MDIDWRAARANQGAIMKRWLCILFTLHALPAQAEWGRLFFTPQQRTAPQTITASAPIAEPSVHRFSGEVQASDGRSLRWIDGQLSSRKLPQGIKPGQSWDAQNGAIYPYSHDEYGR